MPMSEFHPQRADADEIAHVEQSLRHGKKLILAAVGDYSCHKEWIRGDSRFDLILIYYGNDDAVFSDYTKDALICIRQKGQKFPLIKSFIRQNDALFSKYDYIWLPDDDISLLTDDINNLFVAAKDHHLLICQPAVLSCDGVVSHEITRPRKGLKLRFTNFVEVMMPLFERQSLLRLCDDFDLSQSGWGLDVSWSHRLNDPQDKLAVIDAIVARHTKPVGSDYSRFSISPSAELNDMMNKYGIGFLPVNYSCMGLNKRLFPSFYCAKYFLEERWKKIISRGQSGFF